VLPLLLPRTHLSPKKPFEENTTSILIITNVAAVESPRQERSSICSVRDASNPDTARQNANLATGKNIRGCASDSQTLIVEIDR
jgi:hypothetical protein